MDDESTRAGIRRFVQAINTGEMEPLDGLYHDDVIIEWPQSGEVIRGKQNIRELRVAYPTPPKANPRPPCAASWVTVTSGPPKCSSTTPETSSTPSSFTSTAMGG